jgi:hypothetical protein
MTTKISESNIQDSTLSTLLTSGGGGPKISAVIITNDEYTDLDDTAVALEGGYIKLLGSGFETGITVSIDRTPAMSVIFISETELHVQVAARAAGTYMVYAINTDGGVALRINGLTYSSLPTWVTGSSLSGDSGSVISLQLTATDATTFELQAGSTLPTGLTLSSGGLLSGTVTVETETVYNFTIVAIDAELQDSPRSFSINITLGDLQIKYVTALLSPELEVLPFNRDASTNNFAVSVVGDTKPNNFGPYTPGYYSNFFDGTGDFISYPGNVAFNLSAGSWTVECWFYQTSSKEVQLISSGAERWRISVSTSQQVYWLFNNSSGQGIQTSNNTAPLNQWNHVAMCYDGTTNILYLNGVAQTATGALVPGSDNASTFYIGRNPDAGSGWDFNGYISNVRIVKGTAVYTSTFTPPTAPLTAIAGTTLLTCQSSTFIDNSTNNFALTVNGNLAISGFDPFVPNTSYSGYGSTYFDGIGDFLTAQSMTLGTSAFTIEFWAYPTSIPTNAIIFGTTTNGGIQLQTNSGGNLNIGTYGVGNTISTSGGPFVANRWLHIVVVRSGTGANQTSIFFNGVRNVNGTVSTNYVAGPATIGGAASQMFFGYISNFRVVIGTAVYDPTQTTLTVPTEPLTAITNTSLLTCQTNQPANNNVFIDNSTNNFLVTRNGNTTQGTFSPYGGGWSNYFDGTGDYLQTTLTNSALGTENFTIEGWFYWTGSTANNGLFQLSGTAGGFTSASGTLCISIYSDDLRVNVGSNGNSNSTGVSVPTNQWTHFAIVRSSGVSRFYLNGNLVSGFGTAGAQTDTTNYTSTFLGLGGYYSTSYLMSGYISDFRIVKGTAVYTANFTPPTQPLQPIAGTSLLTCARNRFVDDSANNFAVTMAGDVSVQKFSPFTETSLPTPYYSNYFDGTGDYLTVPAGAAFNFGSGDFSIEMWVYPIAQSQYGAILTFDTSGDYPITIGWYGQVSGNIVAAAGTTTAWITESMSFGTTVKNTWTHLVFTRSGNNWRTFQDGVLRGFTTASGTVGDSSGSIHIGSNGNTPNATNCYISNLRIIKGSIPTEYVTSNTTTGTTVFTPPTEPLTAITGTSLLTCQSNRFIDNSTNNFVITAFGNSQPTSFNPFNVAYTTRQRYTPQVFGGSSRFDGTNDWIGSAQNNVTSVMNFAAGQDFTMEFWVYSTSGLADYTIANYGTYREAYGNERVIWITNKSASIFINSGGTGNGNSTQFTALFPASATLPTNSWNHIALVRSSNSIRVYVNGVGGTAVSAPGAAQPLSARYDLAGPHGLWLGVNSTNWTAFNPVGVTGYISDFRYVKGTALYTSNFVPQNTPLTAVRNTVLLINGTSAGVYDSSGMNNFETVGDAKSSTSVVKYGNSSMAFDGTGDYLIAPNSPSTMLGTGDFTIEFWLNTSGGARYVEFGNGLLYRDGNGKLVYYASNATRITSTEVLLLNSTWVHIALVRQSGSSKLYINGIQTGSTFADTINYTLGALVIGTDNGSKTEFFTGHISDLRITKGVARYTATFTPPAAPLKTK